MCGGGLPRRLAARTTWAAPLVRALPFGVKVGSNRLAGHDSARLNEWNGRKLSLTRWAKPEPGAQPKWLLQLTGGASHRLTSSGKAVTRMRVSSKENAKTGIN